MFNKPRDPLQEYLDARQPPRPRLSGRLKLAWQWIKQHDEALHHAWCYGIGLFVAVSVTEWPNMWVTPIVALFMAPVIALAELPTLLVITVIWSLLTTLYQRIRRT